MFFIERDNLGSPAWISGEFHFLGAANVIYGGD